MKRTSFYYPLILLFLVLAGSVQPLSAGGEIPCSEQDNFTPLDAPVIRTYLDAPSSARQGASSWKYDRRSGRTTRSLNKTLDVEITYEDLLEHIGLDQARIIEYVELDTIGIPMDVGEEDVTEATWQMPDLSVYEALETTIHYPRDTATVADFQYFPDATHIFDLGAGNFQFIELVEDVDTFAGYLDNLGYTDSFYIYEVFSTLTPVPMALGLGVYEGSFGPEPCEFFEDGCDSGPEEDHFKITQTYLEVASGTFNTYDDGMADALKLRNTDSITIFDVDSNVINVIVMNYLIWYTKEGHLIKGLLVPDAPWIGNTNFASIEYQKLAPIVLPVEWLDIQAEVVSNRRQVKVNWSTAAETDNAGFVVERSRDGMNFAPISTVAAAGSVAGVQHDYDYVDKDPLSGFNYYRIQQKDFDGRTSYSSIVSALVTSTVDKDELIVLYPNPGRNEVYFSRPAAYELLSLNGQLLASGWAERQIDVSNLPAGTYLVRIDGGEAYRWVKR